MTVVGQETKFMSVNVFIDTNIWVYTIDQRCIDKNKQARQFILNLQKDSQTNIVMSTQVLQEFFSVTTKKLKQDKVAMEKIVHEMAQMPLIHTDFSLIAEAMKISIVHHLTLWDALMVCASKRMKCSILYSEDLHNGHIIDGVKIINPFKL